MIKVKSKDEIIQRLIDILSNETTSDAVYENDIYENGLIDALKWVLTIDEGDKECND
jgi:hypothetical protein|tara:strand:+ start:74 stop:244 length:171 start_codon:yes stop_codon:yes gene_type:complete